MMTELQMNVEALWQGRELVRDKHFQGNSKIGGNPVHQCPLNQPIERNDMTLNLQTFKPNSTYQNKIEISMIIHNGERSQQQGIPWICIPTVVD